MTLFLDELSGNVAPGAHAILVLDGAGWHTAKDLRWPGHVTPLPLPAYSPERNPQERVRLLAIANVRAGMAVEGAARAGGMGRATLYRRLARERTGGPAAPGDHPRSGRGRGMGAGRS